MADPPVSSGAVHVKRIWPLAGLVVVNDPGAPGAVGPTAGVTELEADDATLVPIAFVAVTVKV
jgi:hypothetical protein